MPYCEQLKLVRQQPSGHPSVAHGKEASAHGTRRQREPLELRAEGGRGHDIHIGFPPCEKI